MGKEAVFTMKLEPELRDAFMAAAQEEDRPASQILREMMRDYIERRSSDRQEYAEFLRRKVELSRRSITAGRGTSQEEIETKMVVRRAELLRRTGEAEI